MSLSLSPSLKLGNGLSFLRLGTSTLALSIATAGIALDFTKMTSMDPLVTYANSYTSTTGPATMLDINGKLTFGPHNFQQSSGAIGDAIWNKGAGVGVTMNAAADPLGGNAATLVTTNGGGLSFVGSLNHTLTSGRYLRSVYAKAGTTSKLYIEADGSFADIDLSTGAIVGPYASRCTATSVGNGWWRVSLVATSDVTNANYAFYVDAYGTAAAGKSLYLFGAQLERVTYETTPRTYVPTTTAAVFLPRFGYALGGGTNLFLNSQAFDATWGAADATVSPNVAVAPDGTMTADKLVESATNAVHYIGQSYGSGVVGAQYTASVHLKAADRTWALVLINDGAGFHGNYVNLATGAVGVTFGTPGAFRTVDAGNGWWRVIVTDNAASASSISLRIYTATGDGQASYTGNGSSGILMWGAQLVPGPNPLAYAATGVNLLTYSDDFTQSAWVKTDATVTPNAITAPDGTLSVDLITEGSANNASTVQSYTVTANATVSESVVLKRGNTDWVAVTLFNGSDFIRTFVNLATGTLGTGGASGTGAFGSHAIASLGNGFYRVTLTGALIGYTTYSIAIRTSSGDSTSNRAANGSFYAWAAMVNTVANGGLLNSPESFDNTYWSKSGGITPNAITAPDGTLTADAFVEGVASTKHEVFNNVGIALPAGAHTASIAVKAAGRTVVQLVLDIAGGNNGAVFNLAAGTVVSTLGQSTATITALGNDWYRLSVTRTLSANNYFVSVRSTDQTVSIPGINATAFYLWGAKLVAGGNGGLLAAPEDIGLLGTPWTAAGTVTVVSNETTAPDGTRSADSIARGVTNTSVYMAYPMAGQSVGTTYTLSVYAKARSLGGRFGMRIQGSYPHRVDAVFDLATGALIGSQASTFTGVATTAQSVGNGWYRFTLTGTSATSAMEVVLFGPSATNAVGSWEGSDALCDCYVWGAQLVTGTVAGDYTPVSTLAAYTSLSQTPALPYASTGATVQTPVEKYTQAGTLIEGEARTQLLNATNMAGAATGVVGSGGALPTNWNFGGNATYTATVTAGVTIDGYPAIRLRLQGSGVGGGDRVFVRLGGSAPASAGACTASVRAKLVSGTIPGTVNFNLPAWDNADALLADSYSTGVPGAQFPTDGVFAATLTHPANTAYTEARLSFNVGANSFDFTVELGLPQAEMAATRSSFIPNPSLVGGKSGVTVTRPAETAVMQTVDGAELVQPLQWALTTAGTASGSNLLGALTLTGDGTNDAAYDQAFPTVVNRSYTLTFASSSGSTTRRVGTTKGGADNVANSTTTNGSNTITFVATSPLTWIRFARAVASSATVSGISLREAVPYAGFNNGPSGTYDLWPTARVSARSGSDNTVLVSGRSITVTKNATTANTLVNLYSRPGVPIRVIYTLSGLGIPSCTVTDGISGAGTSITTVSSTQAQTAFVVTPIGGLTTLQFSSNFDHVIQIVGIEEVSATAPIGAAPANLLVNGNLAAGLAGWTVGTDPNQVTATVSGGLATLTRGGGAASGFAQVFPTTAGKSYRIWLRVGPGSNAAYFLNGVTGHSPVVVSTGVHTQEFIANSSSISLSAWPQNTNSSCTVGDFEIREVGLVSNGDFASGTTGWTGRSTGTGTFSVVGGAAQITGTDGSNAGAFDNTTAFTTVSGKTYRATFTVGGVGVFGGVYRGAGAASNYSSASRGVGTHTIFFTADTTTAYIYLVTTGGGGTATIDNIQIEEVTEQGQGALTVEFMLPAINSTRGMDIVTLSDGTTGNRLYIQGNTTGGVNVAIELGGVTQAALTFQGLTAGAILRLSVTWQHNRLTASMNGSTILTDTSCLIPQFSQCLFMNRIDGTRAAMGFLRILNAQLTAQNDAWPPANSALAA